MKNHRYLLQVLLACFVFTYLQSCNNPTTESQVKPPEAKKIAKELTIHNDTRIDNYYWLNQRDNQEVIDYLTAENEYTTKMLAPTDSLQAKLFLEIVGRIKQTEMSVPYLLNRYYYYSRYEEGKEYPFYCRKKENLDAPEEIMLNVNEMAEGYSFFSVGSWDVSPDCKLLAYSVDTVSRRQYTLYVKNLETGEIYPDKIDNTSGSVTWASDNKTIFYDKKDETLRPFEIYRHKLGTSAEADVLVYHENDATFSSIVYKSKSKQFIFIASFSTLSTEYRFLDANNPEGNFTIFQPRTKDMLYYVNHYKDKFYVRTNYEALNFQLMESPLKKTSLENWKVVIPAREDVLLEGIEIFDGFLAINEKKNGLDQLRVINLTNKADYYIPFQDPTYMAYISMNPEFNSNKLRYSYSSLTTPQTVYDFNMDTKEKEMLKQQEVLGDFNPDNYQSERLMATASDGVKVPISIVYRKELKKDGQNPMLITGYGSYGSSTDPYFSSVRLSLLDRGFVFAMAHVRGGQELGRQWYEDGKLLNKKNTFTDFIACTEFLIDQKYTNPKLCFAIGGSAGGLLMGAISNMRPDLYRGIIAAVPFVDVVTTMLDESIPLTTGEYDEWGNPNEKEYYDYILSYSPYDQVEAKAYPAMLITTGLHDSQVQYWEPAKWVAKLRDMKTDNNMLLLSTEMEFGHGGASGRFERFKETAKEYAFILYQLGKLD